MSVAVCIKWVDPRPDIDPLTGAIHTDPRTSAASAADDAALEWALRTGAPLRAVTAGPAGAEAVLRTALAAGATDAVRVELDPSAPSEVVAAALVGALPDDVDLVLCGAWSTDRGSGSVPAFLAARLGAAQALGLISLDYQGRPDMVRAERRLDKGRRERLSIGLPAVLSVEGGSARLRRATLSGTLAAKAAAITVLPGPVAHVAAVRRVPFRPRPRVLPPPAGHSPRERILALTGALSDRTPPQRLVLDPGPAADRILAQLRAWGYVS